MTDAPIEERVRAALLTAAERVEPNPDLFARVCRSIEADRSRRRWRIRVGLSTLAVLGAFTAVGALGSAYQEGQIAMPWWLLELLTTLALVLIALLLGPFIKRFGRSYAADVFRANPRTGKSYLVLTDVAYYLIFLAFIMFTMTFALPPDWKADVVGAQIKHEVSRVGGILLILGLLHSANIVMLPIIGQWLSMNRNLGDGRGRGEPVPPGASPPRGTGSNVNLPPGTWILRIEAAPGTAAPVLEPGNDPSVASPGPGVGE